MSKNVTMSIQAALWAVILFVVSNPAQVQKLIPPKWQDLFAAAVAFLSLYIHQHGCNRDTQGNILAPQSSDIGPVE